MKNYIKSFIKTLTAADVDSMTSNQHELHGVKKLECIFGEITRGDHSKHKYMTTLKIGYQDEGIPVEVTWYNARAKSTDRHEYRLYYAAESERIMSQVQAGDDILIGQDSSDHIDIIVFPRGRSGYLDWTPKN